ncbi:MAG: methyltransferase domain-containing protein, partial [Clostridium sp.]
MRLRKKPWARPELENCDFFIVDPKSNKNKWKESFKNKNEKLYLELGCGKGTFIAVHGSENKDTNYIAIDIKDEVLVLAKRNIEKAYEDAGVSIDNIKFMSQEIGLIEEAIGEEDKVDR